MKKNNAEVEQMRNFIRRIEIINNFIEVFDNITMMPLYRHYEKNTQSTITDLIQYQKIREDIKIEKLPFNFKSYDNLVAQSTLKLTQTPLYIPKLNQSPLGVAPLAA